MAAIRSAARRILGRALAQRPPRPQLLFQPRMLLQPRAPPPALARSSRLFSSGGHRTTTQEPPNEDFASTGAATNNKLREELEEKQVELLLVLKKMESASGDPSVLIELEKKNEELSHVFKKILESHKPEELRDLIVEALQDTGAQQDRSRAEFGTELLLACVSGVLVALMLVMIQAMRKARLLKKCLVGVAGIHVVAATYWYLMSRQTTAEAESVQVVHGGGDVGGGDHGIIETEADDFLSFYPTQ